MVTTIAVVADLHANLYAVQAFLAWLTDHPKVEQVWNLGDFLQIGPHPAEVTDLLLGDARFVNIFGNNEQTLLHRDPSAFSPDEWAHQQWTIAQLGTERLQLPVTCRLTVGGTRVLLTHEPPAPADLDAIDLACCGHTHVPSCTREGNAIVLNPGSLGFGRREHANAFSVIELSESAINVQQLAVAYDVMALKQDYLVRQVPDWEHIWALFLSETERSA